MIANATYNRMKELKIPGMAAEFSRQLENPEQFKGLNFEERFALIVDAEYSRRKSNRITKLLKDAGFEQKFASISDINYEAGRKLDKDLILRLAACEYINEANNVFIIGAAGCGKTYLSNALGVEACKNCFRTKFIRLSDFYLEAEVARQTGADKYTKYIKSFAKNKLLIIDEWLLVKPTYDQKTMILDPLHSRRKKSSVIFCSQYPQDEWYNQLGGKEAPLSDSILDRITHNAYEIDIVGVDPDADISMREYYGFDAKA